jgi:hypothetical protein
MFIYQKSDELGNKLVLKISVYEQYCDISLNDESSDHTMFAMYLLDVVEIKKNDECLNIICEHGNRTLEIVFKPDISILFHKH